MEPAASDHTHSSSYVVRIRSSNDADLEWQQATIDFHGNQTMISDLLAGSLYEVQVGVISEEMGVASGEGDVMVGGYSESLFAVTLPAG